MTHLRVGTGTDKTVDMGAIVDESQMKSVQEIIDDARNEGAEVQQFA